MIYLEAQFSHVSVSHSYSLSIYIARHFQTQIVMQLLSELTTATVKKTDLKAVRVFCPMAFPGRFFVSGVKRDFHSFLTD